MSTTVKTKQILHTAANNPLAVFDYVEDTLYYLGVKNPALEELLGSLDASKVANPEASEASMLGLLRGILSQIAASASETTLTTLAGVDFATQTTLAAVLSRLQSGLTLIGRNSQLTVSILSGAAESSYMDLSGHSMVALKIPVGYDGGDITLMAASTSGGTYTDIYDSAGNAILVTVGGGGRVISLTGMVSEAVAPLQYIKLKCATAVSADMSIVVIVKG